MRGEAADGMEAIKHAPGPRPGIILTDPQMPRTAVLDATRHILETVTAVKAVARRATEDEDAVFEAMRTA